MASLQMPDKAVYCRPFSSTRFEIEHALSANGIHADIRNFSWDHPCEANFRANSYYIDYSLVPRTASARLFNPANPHTPPPGQSVFLPKGVELTAQNRPCESRLLCVTFDHERALSLFEGDARTLVQNPCFDVRAPQIRTILQRLAEEVRNPGFGHDILLESLALTLVVELCRHLQAGERKADDYRGKIADWRLNRLKDRIEAGLAGDISVTCLATECRMSNRHLIRTFKNTTGMALSEYIASVRLRRAQEALTRSDTLIKEIAFECGFKSAAGFSASFQKSTGMTPREYRQQTAQI